MALYITPDVIWSSDLIQKEIDNSYKWINVKPVSWLMRGYNSLVRQKVFQEEWTTSAAMIWTLNNSRPQP